MPQGAEHLLLDLHFKRNDIEGHQLRFADGLVANLDKIRQEYLSFRRLRPHRFVLYGPPCSGKSALAAHLSGMYSIPVVPRDDLASFVSKLPSEEAASAESAIGAKGSAALSPALKAALCRARLADVNIRNRGYILDGYPSTLREARELFTDARDWLPEEVAENEALVALMAETDAAAAAGSAAGKGTKGKAAKGKAESKEEAPAIDDVSGARSVRADLMPTLLVRPRPSHTSFLHLLDLAAPHRGSLAIVWFVGTQRTGQVV